MKNFAFILFLIAGCITCNAQSPLWKHVYNPDRLHIIQPVMTITGTIYHIKKEKDGDLHINVKVDSKFESLLNARNKEAQSGCLVVEIICVGKITQPDAEGPCDNYSNAITVPKKGDHVKITGAYILDTEGNHGWTEIHPVTELIILKP